MVPDELAEGRTVVNANCLTSKVEARFAVLSGELGGLPGTAFESTGDRKNDCSIRISHVPPGPLGVSVAGRFL
jgi:hypothetical protein